MMVPFLRVQHNAYLDDLAAAVVLPAAGRALWIVRCPARITYIIALRPCRLSQWFGLSLGYATVRCNLFCGRNQRSSSSGGGGSSPATARIRATIIYVCEWLGLHYWLRTAG
jgi:hypothetical protein